MPKEKNIQSVAKIKEKLSRAKSVVLTDYQGLTHKQLEQLHLALRNVGAEYLVVKNSLLKIASSSLQSPVSSVGPTAALFSFDDTLSPLKELFKFIKANALPKVKTGTIDGKTYEAAELAVLAALPSRNDLIGQLMFTLNANTQKLAYILTQIKKS
jgi:large subunit ribosomal protein L10